ncbi:MAG: Filamentation induced by cAMP protein Fic [Microgenomates group bacterium GW2011_GWC1_46_16]|nr:MAG: Filamentation induced by cAMP protein Fic [Parcubacteria group bacterium GW2011_GWF1_39_37]KKR52098.1 MAG: Filamentation induced by cAMP protein Fic [Parcubacteria group bacterium GW2011_GWE1_40_20]KKR69208.1 MAG: Filamentation induced by cAMP protein Fic [Parcubacteria group bacterium GW2011_GWF2_40_69]KKS35632.1 MAG: Filamentation induced by cAMP protein Fic [Parcubacteria group bacterium GW2011_GWE2_42_14]KKU25493.1 MAG: Filamentation induced by cAMP protein Fic [Microgenomates group
MDNIIKKFDGRISNPEPHIVALLAEIDGIRGEFKSGLRMTPQAITSLKQSVLITSAGASTRIEGAKLTDEEVEKVMQGLAVSKFADRDTQEVQGYLEVLQNVFDAFQTLPLRESVITSLHNQLLKYSHKDDTHRGGYKKKENTVGVLGPDGNVARIMFETTPAYLTAKEMQELVDWTVDAFEKNRFHSLLIIANFIVEFLKIHPFEDGNGRLSRVLTNLLLLRSGYQFVQYVSHEQIVERRKDEYYLALRKSQETFKTEHDTVVPWLNFFLSVVKEQATKALSYLQEEKVEDTLSPKQYEVWKYISGVGDASRGDIVKATGIAEATINQAIDRLIELGKVKRVGRGRGTRYVKL